MLCDAGCAYLSIPLSKGPDVVGCAFHEGVEPFGGGIYG